MFKKILIANRGEIALRIIRACREMGITTVAVCSEPDRESLHVQLADQVVCIGPGPSTDSYLNCYNVLSAAVMTGAQAIHPGYGFLSENSRFAAMCKRCGITFIGPDAESMEKMGNKIQARLTAKAAGIPVIPGSDGLVTDFSEALTIADKIGYPILVKAAAGGGGRGIRKVENAEELENAIESAKSEARVCFGDDGVYIEKFISSARHIEFQILSDKHGHHVHLFERDCSVQRKNQKLVEEAPSGCLTPELREEMGIMAVKAAMASNYSNAGTVEFLVDRNYNYFFIEMNTRIQVEHPVTEMITGIDLIREQIRIAAGEPLSFTQEDIKINGHAIECRINAEDPDNNFRPSIGKVKALHVPGGLGVRFDSALYSGWTIPPYYDSMIGKLIVHAEDRKHAITRMKCALEEFVVDGLVTNEEYAQRILSHPEFEAAEHDTSFLSRNTLV